MGEIKRYQIGPFSRNHSPDEDVLLESGAIARKSDSGEWVRYEDCIAELDAKDAEIARLQKELAPYQVADFFGFNVQDLTKSQARVRELTEDNERLRATVAQQNAEIARLRAALDKVNAIRNSIVGCQTVNFSEHVYPLVAALDEAGFPGETYAEARKNIGTTLEELARLRARVEELETHCLNVASATGYIHEGDGFASVAAHHDVVIDGIKQLKREASEVFDLREQLRSLTEWRPMAEAPTLVWVLVRTHAGTRRVEMQLEPGYWVAHCPGFIGWLPLPEAKP